MKLQLRKTINVGDKYPRFYLDAILCTLNIDGFKISRENIKKAIRLIDKIYQDGFEDGTNNLNN